MLYIYCAGGFGREVFDIAIRLGIVESEILFIDDVLAGKSDNIIDVAKYKEMRSEQDEIVIAHGEPRARALIHKRLTPLKPKYATIVDPSAVVSRSAVIEAGAIICPLCTISCNANISANSVVNTMSIAGHDCRVGIHSVISSMVNLGGGSVVRSEVYVGMGALIRERVVLEDHSVVSMGSVVHRDVASRHIVQGDPARSRMLNQDGRIFKN